jgi:hypothetical protein
MAMKVDTTSAIGQRGSTKIGSSSTCATSGSQGDAPPERIIRMG